MLVGSSEWGGLLPEARLSAANIFHKNKKGQTKGSSKSLLKAVIWLTERRVHVINFSIPGSSNHVVRSAIAKANKLGIIMVASAGNNGPFTRKKSYPAAYTSVIAVAASDGLGRVANFSTAGSYVEFTAPGVDIWTAVPGGGKAMTGTSISLPASLRQSLNTEELPN